jgi:hypothetical protein
MTVFGLLECHVRPKSQSLTCPFEIFVFVGKNNTHTHTHTHTEREGVSKMTFLPINKIVKY